MGCSRLPTHPFLNAQKGPRSCCGCIGCRLHWLHIAPACAWPRSEAGGQQRGRVRQQDRWLKSFKLLRAVLGSAPAYGLLSAGAWPHNLVSSNCQQARSPRQAGPSCIVCQVASVAYRSAVSPGASTLLSSLLCPPSFAAPRTTRRHRKPGGRAACSSFERVAQVEAAKRPEMLSPAAPQV